MSFQVWVELVCRTCANSFCGQWTTGTIPRREMAKEATRDGRVKHGNEWFCNKDCRRQYLESDES